MDDEDKPIPPDEGGDLQVAGRTGGANTEGGEDILEEEGGRQLEDAMSVDETQSSSGSTSSEGTNQANTTITEAVQHELYPQLKFYEHYVVTGVDPEGIDEFECTTEPMTLLNSTLFTDVPPPGTQEKAELEKSVTEALPSVLQVKLRVRYGGM